MNTELNEAYEHIMQSVKSEDIFGPVDVGLVEEMLKKLKRIYRQLSKAVHPDKFNDNLDEREMANEAFARLTEFFNRASEKIKQGVYGKRQDDHVGAFVIKTKKREYYLGSEFCEGEISTLYRGECIGGDDFAGKVVIKIIDDSADNDLAQNEIRILKMFQQNPGKQSKHLPVFLDEFRTTEGQIGIITRELDGYDLVVVREKYPEGIHQKHMVWIMNRLLSATGFVHYRGVIHGNIDPTHIMIRPRDHNLWMVDWSYAIFNPNQTGERFKVYNPDFSAPEVAEKKTPVPSSDMYSIGKCMIYLLGGDIKTNEMPDNVDIRLQRFIKYFVLESPIQRPRDAWEMHAELIRLVEEMWGPRRFREFVM